METEIRKLHTQHINMFVALIGVFEEVFEMQPFSIPEKKHLQRLLSAPDFLVFVAIQKGRVVGGLTAYVLQQYYSEKPLVYLYDLAVQTEFQRQGIGKKLIAGLNSYSRQQGFEEVFVQADKVDAHAIAFYRSTKPTNEEQVVHFYYTLNL